MAKVELEAPVVAEIAEAVKDAQSVVLVDYRGLTVDQDTALRKQLRAAGVTYKVYKNTMMNLRSREQISRHWLRIWKAPAQSQSLLPTQPLLQESWLISLRQLKSWRSRAAL